MFENYSPLPDAEVIRSEYEESASLPEEYQKVKWASANSMRSRFELAMNMLPFGTAETWLDVGCGTGTFQFLVRSRFPHLTCTGIDLSPTLIKHAAERNETNVCLFMVGDFMELVLPAFNIVTCIGVLQRTNFYAAAFLEKVNALLHHGGCLFLDTKNSIWEEFTKGRLVPDPHLQWFDLENLKRMAAEAGLRPLRASAFDPHSGRIVAEAKSSTIFLVAEKP